jgi:hypothetical protein
MRLNTHVPKDRKTAVADLDAEAAARGRAKNQIVLGARAAYLRLKRARGKRRLRRSHLGATGALHRADLYDERLNARTRTNP